MHLGVCRRQGSHSSTPTPGTAGTGLLLPRWLALERGQTRVNFEPTLVFFGGAGHGTVLCSGNGDIQPGQTGGTWDSLGEKHRARWQGVAHASGVPGDAHTCVHFAEARCAQACAGERGRRAEHTVSACQGTGTDADSTARVGIAGGRAAPWAERAWQTGRQGVSCGATSAAPACCDPAARAPAHSQVLRSPGEL